MIKIWEELTKLYEENEIYKCEAIRKKVAELSFKISESLAELTNLRRQGIYDSREAWKDNFEPSDDKYISNIDSVNNYTISYNAHKCGEYSVTINEQSEYSSNVIYSTYISKELDLLKHYILEYDNYQKLKASRDKLNKELQICLQQLVISDIAQLSDDKIFDLDDSADVNFIAEHIEIPEELQYEITGEFGDYHPVYDHGFINPYESWADEITIDWTYGYDFDEQDLIDYILATYPDKFTGKDLKKFDNQDFYKFLVDKYEDDAYEDAVENYEPPEYEPDYPDYD